MYLADIFQQFTSGLLQTTPLEFIAVIAGISSVWFSRNENILVYPVGLVNTIIYIYISLDAHLFGEASVNVYYTVMSIYGWILWTKKDRRQKHVIMIMQSDKKELLYQALFFLYFYLTLFLILTKLSERFPGTIPWADAFAAASAYTGMWLMARKKVESWYWWIATNMASIPLYFVKGYVFTSFQFLVLLILAFSGLAAWKKKSNYAST